MKKNKAMWQRFHDGDHLETRELKVMERQIRDALPYLNDRCPQFFLAAFKTRLDLAAIEGYLEARKQPKRR